MNYHLAATIAYVLSAIFHFTANRHFTFRSHTAKLHYQASKYLILTLLNYTITMSVITFCIERLTLNAYFSMIIAIAANTATNYLMSKFWVFTTKKHAV
jgi:putative flippase GtrA